MPRKSIARDLAATYAEGPLRPCEHRRRAGKEHKRYIVQYPWSMMDAVAVINDWPQRPAEQTSSVAYGHQVCRQF